MPLFIHSKTPDGRLITFNASMFHSFEVGHPGYANMFSVIATIYGSVGTVVTICSGVTRAAAENIVLQIENMASSGEGIVVIDDKTE